jgi:hypothetical protein
MKKNSDRSTPPQAVPAEILDWIMSLIQHSFHGQIVLVTQNYRLVQIERQEKFNPEEVLENRADSQLASLEPQLRERISQALANLEFGQVVIVVKKGRLGQIERIAKVRYTDLIGLAGDGI